MIPRSGRWVKCDNCSHLFCSIHGDAHSVRLSCDQFEKLSKEVSLLKRVDSAVADIVRTAGQGVACHDQKPHEEMPWLQDQHRTKPWSVSQRNSTERKSGRMQPHVLFSVPHALLLALWGHDHGWAQTQSHPLREVWVPSSWFPLRCLEYVSGGIFLAVPEI